MLGGAGGAPRRLRRGVVDPAAGGPVRLADGAGGDRHGPATARCSPAAWSTGSCTCRGPSPSPTCRGRPDESHPALLRRAGRGANWPRASAGWRPPWRTVSSPSPERRRPNDSAAGDAGLGSTSGTDAGGDAGAVGNPAALRHWDPARCIIGQVFSRSPCSDDHGGVRPVHDHGQGGGAGRDPGRHRAAGPVVIPGTLPYTVPVALLFAVSVVYGRLAADNEVVAVKAAGLGAMTVLWPALLLGLATSGAAAGPQRRLHPAGQPRRQGRRLPEPGGRLLQGPEEGARVATTTWPFLIRVKDVEDKTLHRRLLHAPRDQARRRRTPST